AERSAARRLRRVEVRMRIEPEHADLQGFVRRTRMLEARNHPGHRRTRAEQADREPPFADVLLHRLAKMAERKPELPPAAVLGALVRREADLGHADRRAHLLERFPDAA